MVWIMISCFYRFLSWRRKEAGELHDDVQKYRSHTEGTSCAIVWLGGRLEGRLEDQVRFNFLTVFYQGMVGMGVELEMVGGVPVSMRSYLAELVNTFVNYA